MIQFEGMCLENVPESVKTLERVLASEVDKNVSSDKMLALPPMCMHCQNEKVSE